MKLVLDIMSNIILIALRVCQLQFSIPKAISRKTKKSFIVNLQQQKKGYIFIYSLY